MGGRYPRLQGNDQGTRPDSKDKQTRATLAGVRELAGGGAACQGAIRWARLGCVKSRDSQGMIELRNEHEYNSLPLLYGLRRRSSDVPSVSVSLNNSKLRTSIVGKHAGVGVTMFALGFACEQ